MVFGKTTLPSQLYMISTNMYVKVLIRIYPLTELCSCNLTFQAFDMVNHDKLLKGLNDSDLPPHLKRWLNCYLRGRQSKVQFRNKLSTSRNVRTGVPQGAVTSPLLFCFYLANIPDPPEDIFIIQYADDICI